MTEERNDPKRRTPLQKLEDLNKAKPAAALLGLTIYGLARVSHDAFYAKLGVTVEEVGLDQSTILGRAALYFVFYLALAVSIGALAFAVALSLRTIRASSRRSGEAEPETSAVGTKPSAVDATLLVPIMLAMSVPLVGIIAPQILFTAARVPETDFAFLAKLVAAIALIIVLVFFFVFRWQDVEMYLRNCALLGLW